MPADISRRSITDKAQQINKPLFDAACVARGLAETKYGRESREYDAAQEAVDAAHEAMSPPDGDGYFRDSYDPSSLFWTLGLSWWGDVGPRLGDDNMLSLEDMAWLKGEIEKREITLPPLSDFGGESADEMADYFSAKKEIFVAFLQTALDAGEPIYCSV